MEKIVEMFKMRQVQKGSLGKSVEKSARGA
jgi:hypothetical protein